MELLLHPSVVAVVDLFRSSVAAVPQDLSLADDVEARLGGWSSPSLARSVVVEALVLGVALARERAEPLACLAPGARLTSVDEGRLVALVSASWAREPEAAVTEATAALGLPRDGMAGAAAHRLALHIGQAGLPWPAFESVQPLLALPERAPDDATLPVDDGDAAFRFNI